MKFVLSVFTALFLAFSATAFADDKANDSKDDGWMDLFDGKTLSGWKAGANPKQWKVEEGAIVAGGPASMLYYMGSDEKNPAEFENFHFKADVQTKPGSNSGIFFHTKYQAEGWPEPGYECQVNNTHADPVKTGSLYYVLKLFEAPAKDDIWFTQEIIVKGKAITVKVDGRTLFEYDEPAGITGPHKLGKGTFGLQAHDPKSTTLYKNIKLKILPKE